MSEVTSNACFYGDQADLEMVRSYIAENYSCASNKFKNGKLFVDGLGSLSDSGKAYGSLAKMFPQIAFVAYEFYCNVGEFGFMYSAKTSGSYEEVCPYSSDDDDDLDLDFDFDFDFDFDSDTEDAAAFDECLTDDDESEIPWHEKIRDAVGDEGLRDLFDFCRFDGAWVFKDVPGFENEDGGRSS